MNRPLPFRSPLLLSTILAGSLVLSPSALAATETQAESPSDVIIVTARKRAENVNDIPISIHVETGRSLKNKRALDGQSILRDVAGASLGTFGDRSNGFVVMRGVAPILSPLSPDDSSVLTFIDGAPLPIGATFSSSYIDVERVEIMKGPQNTLFGRNTSGGAINLIPVEPGEEFEGSLRGEIGNDGIYRVEAMANLPIAPGLVSGRIAVRRSAIDGYIPNVAGEDLGREDTWVGRASLLFTFSPDTRWLLSAQAEDTDTAPTTYIAERANGTKIAAQNLTIDDTSVLMLNSRFEHDFPGATLTVQTSYSRLKNSNYYNYPDANIAADFSGLPAEDFLDPTTNFIGWEKRDTRLSQELRLASRTGASIGWLVGASFYRDEAHRDRPVEMWYFGPSATGLSIYDQTTTGQAIFGEISLPLSGGLKLDLSARGTRETKEFEAEYLSTGNSGEMPYFAEDGRRRYEFLTGRAALSYQWSPDVMTYASIARGYKSGGFAINNSLQWAGVERDPYDSSSVISYEAGFRVTSSDRSFRMNGAVFLNDIRKEQMQTWDYNTFTGQNLNLDARTAGFELDAALQLTSALTVSAGVAHTFSELRNVPAEASAAQDGLASGNWLPTVPRWTGRAAAEYRADAGSLGLGGAEIAARVAWNYTGRRFTDASNFGRLPEMHIISARLGIDWGGGEFYVFGDNLLNKEYLVIKDRMGTDLVGDPVFGVSYGRGATFGTGLALRF